MLDLPIHCVNQEHWMSINLLIYCGHCDCCQWRVHALFFTGILWWIMERQSAVSHMHTGTNQKMHRPIHNVYDDGWLWCCLFVMQQFTERRYMCVHILLATQQLFCYSRLIVYVQFAILWFKSVALLEQATNRKWRGLFVFEHAFTRMHQKKMLRICFQFVQTVSTYFDSITTKCDSNPNGVIEKTPKECHIFPCREMGC